MALSRITVWVAGQILKAADLNSEFNNVLNNPLTLISPTTGTINFNNNQALSFALEVLSVNPVTTQQGRVFFQTSGNLVEVDDGTIIRGIPSVPTTSVTAGDILVSQVSITGTSSGAPLSGAGAWKVLPIGTKNQVLTVSSSTPVWGSPQSAARSVNVFTSGDVTFVTSSFAVLSPQATLTPNSTAARLLLSMAGTVNFLAGNVGTPTVAVTLFLDGVNLGSPINGIVAYANLSTASVGAITLPVAITMITSVVSTVAHIMEVRGRVNVSSTAALVVSDPALFMSMLEVLTTG